MNKSIDLKMAIYALVVGLACAFLRKITAPGIPDTISLTIGGILLVISLGLTIHEVKKDLHFLYAFAENWRGDGLMNSGFILGVTNYFMFTNHINGFVSAIVLACGMLLIRTGVRKAARKNLEK
ncbi:MAG: hypothetical protein SOW18_04165 [Peptoniphilus sp.]|nr:hypothetical protein [Peptoniphilus sp.]MDY3118715.1 hypothetical protein [Peptoniphilus sp.]